MTVVSKSAGACAFGNDELETVKSKAAAFDVVSKGAARRPFGNDVAVFVRVRKRKLKMKWVHGRRRNICYRCKRFDNLPTVSASYDVVRAVRINGKPRQKFIAGLGSLQTPISTWGLLWFWRDALAKIQIFSERQRSSIFAGLIRKGVGTVTKADCQEFVEHYKNWMKLEDFADLLRTNGVDPMSNLDARLDKRAK